MKDKEKQIDEIAKLICTYPQCIHYNIIGECANTECQTVDIAERLYTAGYRKQSEKDEEYKERIYNQREELHRLNKRINDLIQSREAWKKKAERVGKQLHEVLSKQSEGEWIVCGMFDDFCKCSSCGDKHPWQTAIEYKFCPNCGAKMKGGAE